jgi:hypothetical protein
LQNCGKLHNKYEDFAFKFIYLIQIRSKRSKIVFNMGPMQGKWNRFLAPINWAWRVTWKPHTGKLWNPLSFEEMDIWKPQHDPQNCWHDPIYLIGSFVFLGHWTDWDDFYALDSQYSLSNTLYFVGYATTIKCCYIHTPRNPMYLIGSFIFLGHWTDRDDFCKLNSQYSLSNALYFVEYVTMIKCCYIQTPGNPMSLRQGNFIFLGHWTDRHDFCTLNSQYSISNVCILLGMSQWLNVATYIPQEIQCIW